MPAITGRIFEPEPGRIARGYTISVRESPFSFPPAPSPEAIKGFAKRFKAFRLFVRTEACPVRFSVDNKLCKLFRGLDERRPFPAEVEPEELHERRAVVEPRFTQNPPEGGMGNTFQDGLTQLFFRPDGLCRCRVGMTVRIDTTVPSGYLRQGLAHDLST